MMVAYTKSILTTHKPMKKLTTIFFAIASAFMLSSCGDSKDKVFDDAMDLMEEMIAATAKGDEAKMKELEKKAEELDKRAKGLGLDMDNMDTLTDAQKKRMGEAMQKMMEAAMKNAGGGQ